MGYNGFIAAVHHFGTVSRITAGEEEIWDSFPLSALQSSLLGIGVKQLYPRFAPRLLFLQCKLQPTQKHLKHLWVNTLGDIEVSGKP